MNRATLIRGARQLLTLSGESGPRAGNAARELRIIPDGALLIVDGKIAEVGPSRRVERLAAARKAEIVEEANGRVVMPAFVDCCVSLLCGPPRYGGEPAEAEAKELCDWSAQRMDLEARRRLRGFVRSGTTTLAAGCGVSFDESTELKALRVLNAIADRFISVIPVLHAHRVPPGQADCAAYREWICSRLIPEVKDRKLAGAVETGDWPDVRRAAADAGLRSRVRLEDGTVSANGVTVLLPGHERRERSGPLALSTGFHATDSPFLSMQTALWLARSQWGMAREEAIIAATINAAYALGLADRAGSLEPGKDADILMLQTGDYRELGWYPGTSATAAVIRGGVQIFPRVGAAV